VPVLLFKCRLCERWVKNICRGETRCCILSVDETIVHDPGQLSGLSVKQWDGRMSSGGEQLVDSQEIENEQVLGEILKSPLLAAMHQFPILANWQHL